MIPTEQQFHCECNVPQDCWSPRRTAVTLFSPGVFEIRDQVLEEDMESTEDRLLLASQVAMLQKCLIELLNWLEVNLLVIMMLGRRFD